MNPEKGEEPIALGLIGIQQQLQAVPPLTMTR